MNVWLLAGEHGLVGTCSGHEKAHHRRRRTMDKQEMDERHKFTPTQTHACRVSTYNPAPLPSRPALVSLAGPGYADA
jgi:hypothetical protein